MNSFSRSATLALVVLLAAAAPARRVPVTLQVQPGSALDRAARELVAQDLAEAAHNGDKPLLLVGSAPLAARPGRTDRPAMFVQLQSARECGSAGCSTSVYRFDHDKWGLILDAVSGPIVIDPETHRGMHDLIVHDTDRWIWNGTAYADLHQAPPIAKLRR